VLIAFGGLPGVGKTTLAKALAKRQAAVYLRIDTIEQAVRDGDVLKEDIGPAGYIAGYRLAEENLLLGNTVVADSVNPLQVTRDAWALVAKGASVPLIEVEVICSDPAEHRSRVDSRKSDIEGLTPPTWKAVLERTYEAWSVPHIVIDTAHKSVHDAERELINHLLFARHLTK
jgi:predicted kinase